MIVVNFSFKPPTSFNIGESTLEKNHLSVVNVGKAIISVCTLLSINESILVRNPINVRCVEKPSVWAPTLSSITVCTVERDLMDVLNAGKTLVGTPIWLSTWSATSERNPKDVCVMSLYRWTNRGKYCFISFWTIIAQMDCDTRSSRKGHRLQSILLYFNCQISRQNPMPSPWYPQLPFLDRCLLSVLSVSSGYSIFK